MRGGFVARGLVYGVIGALALALALGAGSGSTTNQQGALALIARAPLGGAAIVARAAGLLAYTVWPSGQAVIGRRLDGADESDKTDRLGNLVSGVAYLGLLVLAVMVLDGSQTGESSAPRRAAAGVLGWPAGPWLIGITGLVFLGVCLYQAPRA